MSDAEKLRDCVKKAQQIRAECESLRDAGLVPPDALWRAALEVVREAALRVEEKAASPVKIGVVGEFSAGKTLLIGSLIGYADALPVSELPTTGNVTSLDFTLVDGLATTKIGPYHIRFLDHDGFRECLAYLLSQAKKRAKQAELREELCDQLNLITADDAAAISKIETWGKAAWSADTTNPNFRFLIREMVIFVRAYAKCGAGLCGGGEPFEVEAHVARRGLELPQLTEGIQGVPFDNLPAPLGSVPSRPEQLSSDQIRDGFPLIRLVSVDVAVSKQIWDFSELTGANRFTLMDFPGLGSDASGVRDLFLCLRELEQIQTILILLNGRRPGGSEGSRLYDLLQSHRPGQDIRDMILVAVGRFDELPLKNEGGEEKLRQLAGAPPAKTAVPAKRPPSLGDFQEEDDEPAPTPAAAASKLAATASKLTEAAVLKELPVLATCLAGAESIVPPGRKDRVVLASPLLHLRFLGERNSGISVGTEEFLDGNKGAADAAAVTAGLWGLTAARLKTSTAKPAAGLTRWLTDFATDGGIGRLRELIQSHVQLHGLKQRSEDVSRDLDKLRKALRELRLAVPGDAPRNTLTSGDKLQAAEQELKALAKLYGDTVHTLSPPRFTVKRDDELVSLEKVLNREIIYRVCEWDEWHALWRQARGGYITEPVAEDDDDFTKAARLEDPDSVEDAAGFPTRSEDFFAPFCRTVEELTAFTRKLFDEGIDAWIAGLQEPTAAGRRAFGAELDRKSLQSEFKALRQGDTAGLAVILRAAVDPTRLKKLVFPDGSAAKIDIPDPNPNVSFPLARAAKESGGRVFAWARDMATAPADSRPERHHGHQAMILRIRDEMIDIIQLEMSNLLSRATKFAADRFCKNLQVMADKLSVASTNRFLLDAILRDPATATTDPADPATQTTARVRQLAAFEI